MEAQHDGHDSESQVDPDSNTTHLISVQVDLAFADLIDSEKLHSLATFVLAAEEQDEPVQLGITITSDEQIHQLNVQYLGHDYPTDVLSFGAEGVPASGLRVELAAPSADAAEYEDEPEDEEDEAEEAESAAQFNFVTPPGMPSYLGDIVISYETAAAQAPDFGQTAAGEVNILLAHGILHLLGYDDHDPVARAAMHRHQEELVREFAAGA